MRQTVTMGRPWSVSATCSMRLVRVQLPPDAAFPPVLAVWAAVVGPLQGSEYAGQAVLADKVTGRKQIASLSGVELLSPSLVNNNHPSLGTLTWMLNLASIVSTLCFQS